MSQAKRLTILILTGLLLIGMIGFIILRINRSPIWFPFGKNIDTQSPKINQFTFDISELSSVDTSLIGYLEFKSIRLKLDSPRALAVDKNNRIYVGGLKEVHCFDSNGVHYQTFPANKQVLCLALNYQNVLFMGLKNSLHLIRNHTKSEGLPIFTNDKSYFTSLALSEDRIFVADAGRRMVWILDTLGQVLGKIKGKGSNNDFPDFVVPSPYMDIVLDSDKSLWVVNPGHLRIEKFTIYGEPITSWGKPGIDIKGFCGCCNPIHLAIMPDGNLVTSEKGIVRVKVYNPQGELLTVVAPPSLFASQKSEPDLAVNSQGTIFVLDTYEKKIRLFKAKGT